MIKLQILILALATTCPLFANVDSIYVEVRSDTVTIWNININENCSFEAVATSSLSHDTITILENDTTDQPLALCDCFFDMNTDLIGLNAGDYVVVVYRSNHGGTAHFVGSKTFHFDGSAMPYIAFSNQSPCHQIVDRVDGRKADLPKLFMLHPNVPNPFNPVTVVSYELGGLSTVSLKVFDVLGREVAALVNEKKEAGEYSVEWNAGNNPSGVYFIRLTAGTFVETRTMLLMR
jgi:hypothetical protein